MIGVAHEHALSSWHGELTELETPLPHRTMVITWLSFNCQWEKNEEKTQEFEVKPKMSVNTTLCQSLPFFLGLQTKRHVNTCRHKIKSTRLYYVILSLYLHAFLAEVQTESHLEPIYTHFGWTPKFLGKKTKPFLGLHLSHAKKQ